MTRVTDLTAAVRADLHRILEVCDEVFLSGHPELSSQIAEIVDRVNRQVEELSYLAAGD
jgi:hypothetical protein